METLDTSCANHPKRTTRVRCSACAKPICLDCMRETSVGMKCPECAALPKKARVAARLLPRYSRAALYGLVVATGLSAALTLIIGGIFGLLLPIMVGLAVAVVCAGGFKAGRDRGLAIIAAVVTVIGLLLGPVLAGMPLAVLLNAKVLLVTGLAAFVAAFRLWD